MIYRIIRKTLIVNKKRIGVTQKVYKAYYQQKEHEAYLKKVSKKHNISFDACDDKGYYVDFISTKIVESIEDMVIKRDRFRKLNSCLKILSEKEMLLIYQYYFQNKSEREISSETGIPQKTIDDRRHRIEKKLKKLMEN